MSTVGAARSTVTTVMAADGGEDAQGAVVAHSCTRIGLTANPPRSLIDFFRRGRRR